MTGRTIRIAAGLVDDGEGRLLLVRKAGTAVFLQPGGKIEPGETAPAALARELFEEIGLRIDGLAVRRLGRFSAPAANEPGCVVEAEVFHLRTRHTPAVGAEIAEAAWVTPEQAAGLTLAPLTRDRLLPLAATLPAPGSIG